MKILRIRFTIARLMVLVIVAAVLTLIVARPSIIEPNIWWASFLYTFDLFAFAGAGLIALIDRGKRQAVCAGIAVFGGLYLLTVFGIGVGAVQNGVSQPPLFTTGLLYHFSPTKGITLDNGRHGEPFKVTEASELFPGVTPGPVRVVNLHEVRRVGHCLFALGFAGLGAWIGFLSWKSRKLEDCQTISTTKS